MSPSSIFSSAHLLPAPSHRRRLMLGEDVTLLILTPRCDAGKSAPTQQSSPDCENSGFCLGLTSSGKEMAGGGSVAGELGRTGGRHKRLEVSSLKSTPNHKQTQAGDRRAKINRRKLNTHRVI